MVCYGIFWSGQYQHMASQYNYSTVQRSNKEHGMSLDLKLIDYVNILHTKHIQVHILDKILGMMIETALL